MRWPISPLSCIQCKAFHLNGVQTVLKCKPNVKRCKRFVFVGHSPLLRHNALKTKAINHFQTDHILTRFVFPPLYGQNSGYPSYYLTGNPKTSTCARCTDGTAGPCRTSPPSSARPRAKCFPPLREAAGSSAYSWSIPSIHIHYGNRYRVLES